MDLEEMWTWCSSPASADDPAVLQVGRCGGVGVGGDEQ
jgi:hypothetical protein